MTRESSEQEPRGDYPENWRPATLRDLPRPVVASALIGFVFGMAISFALSGFRSFTPRVLFAVVCALIFAVLSVPASALYRAVKDSLPVRIVRRLPFTIWFLGSLLLFLHSDDDVFLVAVRELIALPVSIPYELLHGSSHQLPLSMLIGGSACVFVDVCLGMILSRFR